MSVQSWLVVLGLWLALGAAVSAALLRRGEPLHTRLAAVPCWPLFLPLFAAPGAAPREAGPYAPRIVATFAALAETLREEAEPVECDLDGLRGAVERADSRLARVDRLLLDAQAHPEAGVQAQVTALRAARRRAAEEIEVVLAEVVRIRIQVGMVALHQDATPVRAHLAGLAARVRALEELNAAGDRP